jgi:hypothetical protein
LARACTAGVPDRFPRADGAPITYVSGELGHRDASITFRGYAHWLPTGDSTEPSICLMTRMGVW